LGFVFGGNTEMENGTFEAEEAKLVKCLIPKSDVFYCCLARQLGTPVVACEPIWMNVKGLLKNMMANGFESGVEVYPIALSNRIGIAEIYGGGTELH
jgi:hypothetical protein